MNLSRAHALAGTLAAGLLLAGCGTDSIGPGASGVPSSATTPEEAGARSSPPAAHPTDEDGTASRGDGGETEDAGSNADTDGSAGDGTTGNGGRTTGDDTSQPKEGSGTATERCYKKELSARITDVGAAAGNRYAVLVFTNRSNQPCTLDGHPGMRLLDENRESLRTDVHKRPPDPRRVLLRPDEHASASLKWGTVPAPEPPEQARYARIWAPDTYRPLTIPFDTPVSNGVIHITSVVAGNDGARGSP